MLDTVQAYYDVREYTDEAKGIAYDGCHKIYVLMDDEQMELMGEYGYGEDGSFLVSSDQLDPAEMATVAMTWFKDSCGLRFIQGVITDEDPNKGFFDIIAQFESNEGNWDEDEDDDDL
jgi:hypothetical protein